MTTPLDLALVAQTNTSYEEFRSLGTETEDKLKAWVNKGREVGLYLQKLREGNKRWEQLALPMHGAPQEGALTLHFNEVHGRIFMRLADKLKEPATTAIDAIGALKECAMLQGMLQLPDGHGPQNRHSHDALAIIITRTMEIQALFNRDVREQIGSWDTGRKQHLRDQIEPIVKIYELLAA